MIWFLQEMRSIGEYSDSVKTPIPNGITAAQIEELSQKVFVAYVHIFLYPLIVSCLHFVNYVTDVVLSELQK